MDLIETISCVGVTRHIPVNNRVARESFWQGPQDQMECGSKKEREKKEKEEKRTTGQPRKRRWNRCIQTPRVRGGNLQRHTRLAQKRQR
jgi:hypothetical protein